MPDHSLASQLPKCLAARIAGSRSCNIVTYCIISMLMEIIAAALDNYPLNFLHLALTVIDC